MESNFTCMYSNTPTTLRTSNKDKPTAKNTLVAQNFIQISTKQNNDNTLDV